MLSDFTHPVQVNYILCSYKCTKQWSDGHKGYVSYYYFNTYLLHGTESFLRS